VRPVPGRVVEPNPLETSERPTYSDFDTAGKGPNDSRTAITQSKPWLDRTRWQQIFEGANYAVLVALTSLPSNPPTSLRHLGKGLSSTDAPYISIKADEIKISGLVAMFEWILSRCEETARGTSHTVLRWFRSTEPDKIYPRPFNLVSKKESRSKYLRIFQRFLAFIFRIFWLPAFQYQNLVSVRFDSEQQQLLVAITSQ